MKNIEIEGTILEKEQLPAKRGARIKLGIAVQHNILAVNCFSAEAEAALNLPIGAIVRLDCRLVGTEFCPEGEAPKRGIMLVAERLEVIRTPAVGVAGAKQLPRHRESNWHRQAARPIAMNKDGRPQ